MTVYETLESAVAALEARRKANPLNESGFNEVSKLAAQLRTFLNRLEKLK